MLLCNAIRLAQMMGLHREQTTNKLGPVETEIRRRVWNKLRLIDIRLAEEMGYEPSITQSSFDTQMPRDLDDDELTLLDNSWAADHGSDQRNLVSKTAQPASSLKIFTEMTFSLLRYDLAALLNKLLRPGHGGPVALHARDTDQAHLRQQNQEEVDAILQQMQQKYHMTMWSMENSLHRLALRCVNGQIAKARLLIDLQFRGPSGSITQR